MLRSALARSGRGWQAQPSDTTPGNFGQSVNGNYGFAESNVNLDPAARGANGDPVPLYAPLADYGLDPQPLPNRTYLVTVDIPRNPVGDTPMYQATGKEDVNVSAGDEYLPQENFPPGPARPTRPPTHPRRSRPPGRRRRATACSPTAPDPPTSCM